MSPGKKGQMSVEHKAALASGRAAGAAVRKYLEALETTKPKRGRRSSPESLQKQIDVVRTKLNAADALARLLLMHQEQDLVEKVAALGAAVDLSEIEEAFVQVAAQYGSSKGIKYDIWRKAGVPADVLKRAGITR